MRYHNITKDDMLNGDGLRVVLWVAGCDHCCKECHNPVTWDPNGGLFFDEKAKAEIFEELEKDYISGITFSGGDPLHSANAYEVMMPVSYTHLDVYKRQGEAGPTSKIDCKATECQYNKECQCHAGKISVEGSKACSCDETECATFSLSLIHI